MSPLIKVPTLAILLAGGLIAGVLITGCGDKPGAAVGADASKKTGTEAAVAGPAISVTTVIARQRDMPVVLEATGTVTALNSVDVRPQVASTITKVHIKEGQFVKAGQLLFTLDARNDEVNVTKASARSSPRTRRRSPTRSASWRAAATCSRRTSSRRARSTPTRRWSIRSSAVVAADRAAIEPAQVGLSYSRIVAPSGRPRRRDQRLSRQHGAAERATRW